MSTSNLLFRQLSTILFKNVISEESSPYHQIIKKMNDIDFDYFNKIPAWTEQLPSELDYQLKDNILKDFNKLANELLGLELKSKCIDLFIGKWKSIPNHEDENRETIAEGTMASIKQFATLFGSVSTSVSEVCDFRDAVQSWTNIFISIIGFKKDQ